MAYTKQVKAAFPLNNGFTNSFQSGDGINLFSASGDGVTGGDGHLLVDGGKNDNRPSTGADLNETSLEDAIINIAAFKDQRGLLIAAKPKRLIVPPALQFVATRLLESQDRVSTADNDINAIWMHSDEEYDPAVSEEPSNEFNIHELTDEDYDYYNNNNIQVNESNNDNYNIERSIWQNENDNHNGNGNDKAECIRVIVNN